ncbi:hypothetical protein TNCV_690971 [Trichonephila clavipes]|nr:hypothetical protein TNCV_690971 [Trichonephila clavipes]
MPVKSVDAQRSSRWCGMEVRRGGESAISGVVLVTWPWFIITSRATKNDSPLQSPVFGPKLDLTKDCKTITIGPPRTMDPSAMGGCGGVHYATVITTLVSSGVTYISHCGGSQSLCYAMVLPSFVGPTCTLKPDFAGG